MNGASAEPIRWTPRRWLSAISIVLLAQVALVLILGERLRPAAPPRVFGTRVHWLADPQLSARVAAVAAADDPALFALPGLQGFSSRAWLVYPELPFRPEDWTEPPRWLALQPEGLGNSFTSLLPAEKFPPLLVADKPMPRPRRAGSGLPPAPAPAESTFRLTGSLAGRPLLQPLVFPAWPYPDVLPDTVLQLLVDPSGGVLTVSVLESCGVKEADQHALRLATSAVFEPLGAASAREVAIGRLIVQWMVVPPNNPGSSAAATPATAPPE